MHFVFVVAVAVAEHPSLADQEDNYSSSRVNPSLEISGYMRPWETMCWKIKELSAIRAGKSRNIHDAVIDLSLQMAAMDTDLKLKH
jgi:hypothetical protein